MHSAAYPRIIERRRQNYLALLEGLSDLDGCCPLVCELPAAVVPYMFPLYIQELERVFPIFEDCALPMQRFGQFLWPGVDQESCSISSDYSKHLLQLPCHQEISSAEIEWIIGTVRRVIQESTARQSFRVQ